MTILAIAFAFAVLVLLFPAPFVRAVCRRTVLFRLDGVTYVLRIQPRWLNVILGSPAATTFDRDCITIDVLYWDKLNRANRERLIRHELAHCAQAVRLGVWYLPVYLARLIRYGYKNHPQERDANAKEHG